MIDGLMAAPIHIAIAVVMQRHTYMFIHVLTEILIDEMLDILIDVDIEMRTWYSIGMLLEILTADMINILMPVKIEIHIDISNL